MSYAHQVLQVLYFFLPAYVANMSPVLVRGRFKALALPIDGGRWLWGKRILGDHKTWRGLAQFDEVRKQLGSEVLKLVDL